MLKYPLSEFVYTVPICSKTATLKVVLKIFETQQCDRLVVLNEQQNPVGVIDSARLLPEIFAANQGNTNQAGSLNLQQPLANRESSLIQPIQTLPSDLGIEEFTHLLRSQQTKNNINRDWALIDPEGKFLGLIDSSRLLQFLFRQKAQTQPQSEDSTHKTKSRRRKAPVAAKTTKEVKQTTPPFLPLPNHPLIQLLERLPWPLMLQTNTGKVVTQNPAWWEQLGILKDPEGIRQQVEAILNPTVVKNLEYATHRSLADISTKNNADRHQAQPIFTKTLVRDDNLSTSSEVLLPTATTEYSVLSTPLEPPTQLSSNVNRCFLDSQHGTCTCIVEIQNGQERVWQFAKIPLDSPELKAKNPSSDTALNSDLWLMLATDVTEQQQLCKELAAKNADLMQLNRLKDEFLACISHELKTPLTAVLGLSRLLVDQQLGELNERQARYAGLIHQSGRHLMSVVNNILDLTRMETGQMELMLAIVNIRTVCDRAVDEAKAIHAQSRKTTVSSHPQPGGEEHKFNLSIEPGLEEIVADEFRLRQMLVHLLSNAFKFTETGGEIGLRVSRWEGWVTFTVWDTGLGIPEHQQHLIFQKFQQLEHPLTRQFEGTGLGLVLTRALARLHGGDVSFLSREGKGSQFTLLLPPSPPKEVGRLADEEIGTQMKRRSQNHEMARKISPHHSTTPKLRTQQNWEQISTTSSHHSTSSQQLVLVVEAVARYIEDFTEQLTGLGYRVVIARSGCEAVEKARRLQPKAVFLNPLLPLLSGWDVLTLLKSDATTRHIPVIVTATAAEKEQAFANRADGFLSLPVEPQFLAPLLENLYTVSQKKQQTKETKTVLSHTPLRILRFVHPEGENLDLYPLLQQHRIIEVDDIEQAELLARVWQFDVILLDPEVPAATAYLQKLSNLPRLANLPIVTCDVRTTQTASQIAGLSVFPCLTRSHTNNSDKNKKIDALLSVLQIAVGISCPPSILVVELAALPDLPDAKRKHSTSKSLEQDSQVKDFPHQGFKPLTISRGSEWFQALIQYLHTAGLKATIGRSWEELLQQLRHKSVDLLLICLEESSLKKEVYSALKTLGELPVKLPPVLVLDQQLNPDFTQEQSLENAVGAIASQVLPRSISMEDLLNHINQALSTSD